MPSRRQRWSLVLIAVFVIAFLGALPQLFKYIDGIHPRNVTISLAQIEEQYRSRGSDGGDQHAKEMLDYVENYYRYEDMPNHRGTPVANELARQRKRTIEAIEQYLKRQQ